jgi:hypothetical protein
MRRLRPHSRLLILAGAFVLGCAQSTYLSQFVPIADGPLRGHQCDTSLTDFHVPAINDMIDSAKADAILAAVDPEWTRVWVGYAPAGNVDSVVFKDVKRSIANERAAVLRRELRPLPPYHSRFDVMLLRTEEGTRLLAGTVTCRVEMHETDESKRLGQIAHRALPGDRRSGTVTFAVVVEASGRLGPIHAIKRSGLAILDLRTATMVRAFVYTPALAGTQPVPMLVYQPVEIK